MENIRVDLPHFKRILAGISAGLPVYRAIAQAYDVNECELVAGPHGQPSRFMEKLATSVMEFMRESPSRRASWDDAIKLQTETFQWQLVDLADFGQGSPQALRLRIEARVKAIEIQNARLAEGKETPGVIAVDSELWRSLNPDGPESAVPAIPGE